MLVPLIDRRVVACVDRTVVVDFDRNSFEFVISKSPNKRAIHMDTFVPRHDALYTAAEVQVATQVCFLDLQLTDSPATKKIAPLVDFLVILHPP